MGILMHWAVGACHFRVTRHYQLRRNRRDTQENGALLALMPCKNGQNYQFSLIMRCLIPLFALFFLVGCQDEEPPFNPNSVFKEPLESVLPIKFKRVSCDDEYTCWYDFDRGNINVSNNQLAFLIVDELHSVDQFTAAPWLAEQIFLTEAEADELKKTLRQHVSDGEAEFKGSIGDVEYKYFNSENDYTEYTYYNLIIQKR